MNKFQWGPKYIIGNNIIDNQHQQLLETINNLIENKSKMKDEETKKLFNYLVNYAKTHFKDEEKLMKINNYPYINDHMKEHNFFLEELLKISSEIDHKNSNVNINILSLLENWLQHHVLIIDKDISNFLKK